LLICVKVNSLFNSFKKKLAEIMTYLVLMLALREVQCDIKYVKNVIIFRLSLSKFDGNLLIHQFEWFHDEFCFEFIRKLYLE